MALPDRLWLVRFSVARLEDRPHDRRTRTRYFTRAQDAARQVAAVLRWVPSHAETPEVHVTACDWQPVDLAALPEPEEHEWQT